ncbi:MAG: hypothetical protein K6F90_02005 [Lachnospiraceae bacterium]|nr:hypothetical protein [Lachnospiraceae bacterium]
MLRLYIQKNTESEKIDISYFAIDPDGFLNPEVYLGEKLGTDANTIVLDDDFESETASLDSERGHHVVEMIRLEVHKRNKAAIMVTHDERVLDLADRIYDMEDGNLAER